MPDRQKSILVGDLNIAPREDDVWNHKQLLKIVSHTPVEVEHLAQTQEAGGWVDITRAGYSRGAALQLVVLSRARTGMRPTRGGGWIMSGPRPILLEPAIPAACLRDARGWEKPSDHAPVFATFDL